MFVDERPVLLLALAQALVGRAALALDDEGARREARRPRHERERERDDPVRRPARPRRRTRARPSRSSAAARGSAESSSGRSSGSASGSRSANELRPSPAARKPSAQIISPRKLGPCEPAITTSIGQVSAATARSGCADAEAPQVRRSEPVALEREHLEPDEREQEVEQRIAEQEELVPVVISSGVVGAARRARSVTRRTSGSASSRKSPKEREPRGASSRIDAPASTGNIHQATSASGREVAPAGHLGDEPRRRRRVAQTAHASAPGDPGAAEVRARRAADDVERRESGRRRRRRSRRARRARRSRSGNAYAAVRKRPTSDRAEPPMCTARKAGGSIPRPRVRRVGLTRSAPGAGPVATACVRVAAPSRSQAFWTWVRTVSPLIPSLRADLVVREAFGEVDEDVPLAVGREPDGRSPFGRTSDQGRERRVDVGPSGDDGLERAEDVDERRLLQDDAGCAGAEDVSGESTRPRRPCRRRPSCRATPRTRRATRSAPASFGMRKSTSATSGRLGLGEGDRLGAVRGRRRRPRRRSARGSPRSRRRARDGRLRGGSAWSCGEEGADAGLELLHGVCRP